MFEILERQTRLTRYGQAGVAFWLLGFETKGRSIEEIDSSLANATPRATIAPQQPALPG